MKTKIALVLSLFIFFGCFVDYRFPAVPSERVTIDDYPIDVKILKVSDTIYDVRAMDGRVIGFTGFEPMLQQIRFRKAAITVMRHRFGPEATISIVEENFPSSAAHMYFRFNVQH